MATGVRTIASALDAVASRAPSSMALISPFEQITQNRFTYRELQHKTNALAAWLTMYGFEKNDLLLSDLPNTSENIMLQIACNRIGVGYGTSKSLEHMASTFSKVKGTVSNSSSSFLAQTNLPLPYLSAEFIQDLIHDGGLEGYVDGVDGDKEEDNDQEEVVDDDGDALTAHGFYNTATPYTNQQAIDHGRDAGFELAITDDDIVCVSITLCHPFGIGSAVCSALLSGATIALPAVGGIQGCGIPSERAVATLEVLQSEECTLLFADTHTLKALPEPSNVLPKFRGGVCKIGSGATFLEETRKYSGVTLRTVGKKTDD